MARRCDHYVFRYPLPASSSFLREARRVTAFEIWRFPARAGMEFS
jgi:hypothetical protein